MYYLIDIPPVVYIWNKGRCACSIEENMTQKNLGQAIQSLCPNLEIPDEAAGALCSIVMNAVAGVVKVSSREKVGLGGADFCGLGDGLAGELGCS